jgi:hypothetical protein
VSRLARRIADRRCVQNAVLAVVLLADGQRRLRSCPTTPSIH